MFWSDKKGWSSASDNTPITTPYLVILFSNNSGYYFNWKVIIYFLVGKEYHDSDI